MNEATTEATRFRLLRGGSGLSTLRERVRGMMARRRWRWLSYAFLAMLAIYWLMIFKPV